MNAREKNDRSPLNESDRELLSAWMDGEVADTTAVDHLLSISPEATAYVEQLRRVRDAYHAGRSPVEMDPEALVAGVIRRIQDESVVDGIPGSVTPKGIRFPWKWAAAAAVLLILSGGGLLVGKIRSDQGPATNGSRPEVSGPLAEDSTSDALPSDMLLEDFSLTAGLPDLLDTLAEEDLLLCAALLDAEEDPAEIQETSGLWWEQAERLAVLFENTASEDPLFSGGQP